eukprot:COSAG05_NODE_5031_length_1284_cov_1.417722_2_plen_105_part_01
MLHAYSVSVTATPHTTATVCKLIDNASLGCDLPTCLLLQCTWRQSCTAAFNDLAEERDPALLAPLFRGFRYHLGENLAVVRPEGVPVVTPNRVPVLSWGPRVLGA